MTDICRSFDKLIKNIFPVYKGVRLEVVDDGYILCGKKYLTLNEVDEEIDRRMTILAKAIADSN